MSGGSSGLSSGFATMNLGGSGLGNASGLIGGGIQ